MKATLLALGATALFSVTAAQAASITLPSQTLGSSTVQVDGDTNWTSNNAFIDGLHLPSASTPEVRGPMSFDQFDDQGGTRTLTQVKIAVSGAWEGELEVNAGASNATVTQADLLVRFVVDVFNDYAGLTTLADVEISGFQGTPNYDADLDTLDSWDQDPPGSVPFTLNAGESFTDSSLSGSFSDQLTLTTGLSPFIGTGSFDIGCLARSDDALEASGSGTTRGHSARAECTVGVEYVYTTNNGDTPVPAPMALMGLGLIGLAGMRRLRK
jgi:hypothetical protein